MSRFLKLFLYFIFSEIIFIKFKCQGFEVNLRTENSANVIELSVCRALSVLFCLYLRGVAERPVYIGVKA